jgi:hypothetical protein
MKWNLTEKTLRYPIALIAAAVVCFGLTVLMAYLGGAFPFSSTYISTVPLLWAFVFGPASIGLFITGIVMFIISVSSKQDSTIETDLISNKNKSAAPVFFSLLSILCSFRTLIGPFPEGLIYVAIGGILGLIMTINNIVIKRYSILWISVFAVVLSPIIAAITFFISMY